MSEISSRFDRLVTIMNELREKCPWDKKQTIHTLRPLSIEELYELADAITEEDWQGICEELGDLLLHVVFYARIGEEQGKFTLKEVLDGICDKLITRHPHIYGEVQADNEQQVKQNWEKLKLASGKSSVLQGVPQALPALVKAIRLQDKAAQIGFDWTEAKAVWGKVEEETRELQQAVAEGESAAIEEEFGDLLFSLANYSRFLHIDAENALERTNKKFLRRFQRMEEQARQSGKALASLSFAEMDALWEQAKRQEKP
jgi:XTP/dITP diphosphohydrolase